MFTREEKKQINKSRKTIVKDMKNIWDMYPYEEISIPVKIDMSEYGYNWELIINRKQIIIKSETGSYTRLYPRTLTRNREAGYKAHYQFISQYDEVREKLLSIVNKRLAKEEHTIKTLSSVSDKYKEQKKEEKKEALVQIDMPNSINVKEIEISEENNKKIGTIDFGSHTIKIITEGNIVLVNKTKEEPKIKRK